MKKSIVVLVMVMLAVAVSTSVFGQKSTMYVGDKSAAEIAKSIELYSGLIEKLESKKTALESKRGKLLKSPDNEFLVIKNDSIISIYESKIMDLTDQLIAFTELAAGKDQINTTSLKSRNLPELTDAIIAINYYGKKGNNPSADINSTSKDSAQIYNDWVRDVFVTISGPARFRTSFKIKGGSKVVVPIPGPGSFLVTYDFGNEKKCTYRKFDGMNADFDSANGKKYAFISGINRR